MPRSSVVIVADRNLEDRVLGRLTDFRARVVTGATFAGFIREVGHGAQAADHLLVFGYTGDAYGLNAYSRYEAGLRSLAGDDAALASAVAKLERSTVAGGLAFPLTSLSVDIWAADWRGAGAPLDTVPLHGNHCSAQLG